MPASSTRASAIRGAKPSTVVRLASATVLAAWACMTPVHAATYTDKARGFAIDYPDGWVPPFLSCSMTWSRL